MSDLENMVEEKVENSDQSVSAEAPMVDDIAQDAEAPFLTDEQAAAVSDEASPFDAVIAQVEESKKAPAKKVPARNKKTGLIDLKKPLKLEPMDPSEVPMRWYILQAYSGFEQRVAQALIERIKINNMEEYFGEVLVPKEKVKDVRDGKQRESERKFFPGYVMVEMKMTSDSWQLVKHTERVLGFIGGTPERPLPITKAEADRILNRLKETSEAPRPKNLFEVGEKVRATEGTFKDFSGTVEKVDYEKNRLTVSINIFGRATPVELELGQVEKDID